MKNNVRIKIELEFESESESIHFADIIKNIIPDFDSMPTVHSDNTLSLSTGAYVHQVIDFIKASILMGEGFDMMMSGKKILDNIQTFREEISRLLQNNPDEYLDKTVIQNVDGGHSIYIGKLSDGEILDRVRVSSYATKIPQILYITPDGDVKEMGNIR